MRRGQAWIWLGTWFIGAVIFVSVAGREIGPLRMPEDISSFFLWQETTDGESGTVRVKRVIDGDTIELENGDKVRYIGIDTPESVKPNTPIQCFAKEAAARNRELVLDKEVRLEHDVSDRDRYGRLLRYVYVGDVFVNAELVRQGYAKSASFPPDIAKQDLFRSLEREAREAKRGLFADDACQDKK